MHDAHDEGSPAQAEELVLMAVLSFSGVEMQVRVRHAIVLVRVHMDRPAFCQPEQNIGAQEHQHASHKKFQYLR